MKPIHPQTIGLQDNGDGYSISQLLSALSTQQYLGLIGFARHRLRAMTNARWLQQCLAVIDGQDLVHQALLKLHLGEDNPSLGRHLKAHNCLNLEAFLACVKGIINSDLSHVVQEARNRYEKKPVGDPELEPNAVDPAEPQDPHQLLSRRDLRRVLFQKLYDRIQNQPALLAVVQDWEQGFLENDRIGSEYPDRNLVHRVRQLAREILKELAEELGQSSADPKEMLL